jgi:hypothetical protein
LVLLLVIVIELKEEAVLRVKAASSLSHNPDTAKPPSYSAIFHIHLIAESKLILPPQKNMLNLIQVVNLFIIFEEA